LLRYKHGENSRSRGDVRADRNWCADGGIIAGSVQTS
jgi:hypothetical protein